MRDHGGNLDAAIAVFGGLPEEWIDLSTGINRVPYPVRGLPMSVWTDLPSRAALAELRAVARRAYGSTAPVVALAGAQAAIQIYPWLSAPGTARVLGPTYNEHAASLRDVGWQVEEVRDPDDLAGADLAVIVNPNNPTGGIVGRDAVLTLADRVGQLVVDESFADPVPEISVAADAGRNNMLVLRSFGKFFGLAGLRLGFAFGSERDIDLMTAMAGPWPVSGAAIEIGLRALVDRDWARRTTERLAADRRRLDTLALRAGWGLAGGAHLFCLYETPDAQRAQVRLARARIWSRVFPYSPTWLRLGLPGSEEEWTRMATALVPGDGVPRSAARS